MVTVLYVDQLSHIWRKAFIQSTFSDLALVLGYVLDIGHITMHQTRVLLSGNSQLLDDLRKNPNQKAAVAHAMYGTEFWNSLLPQIAP